MLGPLHSERQLAAIEAASVPHLEQKDQNRVIRSHQRRLDRLDEPAPQSAHEALMAAGIPVKYTKKEG